MMRSILWAAGLVAMGVVSFSASGCGSTQTEDPDAGVVQDSGPGFDASFQDVPSLGDSAQPTSCDSSVLHCSADLQNYVDCNGKVVKACPTGFGCGDDGTCIPACEAAKAAKGSLGCDFYVMHPYTAAFNDCYAAFVVNAWGTPVDIQIERGSTTFDPADFTYIPSGNGQSITYEPLPGGTLPAGEVGIMFLGSNEFGGGIACPPDTNVATHESTFVDGTGIGQAFHVTTSVPVVMYDIDPYGGGQSAVTSSSLLLPTSAWGDNYIGVDGYDSNDNWISIVAAEDGTDVTVSPTANIVGGGGVDPVAQGTLHTYSLQKGQILQFSQTAELVGTPIQSTKPIGVWGGVMCTFVPLDKAYCDSLHQQIPPIKALGSEYAAVRHRNRYDGIDESPPWRIVGAVDGTTLTYVPSAPSGAPTSLASGDMVEFNADAPFIVKSQDADHPFYLSEYMSGCSTYGDDHDCRGDPELVNVLPPQQYLKGYTFFTDPTYSETHLVVVRAKTEGHFEDVTLDCAGKLGGWTPLGTDYEWTRTDLVRHNFEPQGTCDNGRHEIGSAGPFGVTVWGWGSAESGNTGVGDGFYTQCVSYGYPAGGGARNINTVVVPPVVK